MISDIDFLREENAKKPVDPPPALISEWVQGHRVLPTNTPFPGFWDNEKTPYLIEVMDNMSPFSPVQITSVMKGCQLGFTAGAENVIGYFMQPVPAEVLYVSATDSLLEKWAAKRLEPLIDSIGMRENITAQLDPSKAKSSRRSGDKVLSKEYPGGTLNMASAQSASGLRSDSKRILVLDEIDGAPRMLKTGEGNWLDVVYGRIAAWGVRGKVMEFSTPTTEADSRIRERYEMGDRRKYHVPCPHCGTMDELEFKHLRHEMKDGRLFRVWYQCPHCDGEIYNHHKNAMLSAGEWVPTAQARKAGHRSYHISSLYSPVGMLSWFDLYQFYLDAQLTPGGMRSFVNLYLGLPYKEKGHRPKADKLLEHVGDYLDGQEVPDGVIYLTMGLDVQQGSKTDPANPPRVEFEVVGHGAGRRTWSLLYKRFEGDITDAHAGAWEDLHQWAMNGGLNIRRSDGVLFPVSLIFMDSSDGNVMDVVYAFTARWQNTYPIKGVNALKKRKDEKGDEAGPLDFKRYRAAKNDRSGDILFYEISTNYYKSWTYSNLNIPRRDTGEEQPPGFCHFPRDRGEKYFLGLTAEEKRTDGSFHNSGRRNEPLDCRVYALCAADVYLDALVSDLRARAKKQKPDISPVELQKVDHRYALEYLRRRVPPRRLAA